MDVSLRERGVFAFGPFRLDPTRRSLQRNGCEVALTARLFDTLLYLVQHPDRLVTRDELESAVWGGRAVEAGNLQKAISSLRQALQSDPADEAYIVTVAGRGFRFARPVSFEPEPVEAFAQAPATGGEPPAQAPAARAASGWRGWGVIAAGLVALAVAGGAVWHLANRPAPFAPPPHSVAVMAFSNLSGDPGQEYFSDGLSEELIDALGRTGAMRVAARVSAFSFKAKPATIADIARQLNVGAVLEGSVRRDGKRLRVTAQLIDASTGFALWSRSFDQEQGDIFKIQDEIADAVTGSMQMSLLGADAPGRTLGGTTNPKALDAYLRGRGIQEQSNEVSDRDAEALAAYNEAIALDANYALAYVSRTYALDNTAYNSSSSDQAKNDAIQADAMASANRAIALAPDLGSAHAARGYMLSEYFDFPGAAAEYDRALKLAPGDPAIMVDYAELQLAMGQTERAIAAAQQATDLDPLSFHSYTQLAWIYFDAKRYDDALAALRHAQQVATAGMRLPGGEKGEIELMNGNPAAAQRDCADRSDVLQNICLAMAYHALGKQDDALKQVDKVHAAVGDNAAYNYAGIYAQWGDIPKALHWLEAAYVLRDPGLKYVKVDPTLDPLRDTPEYRDVVRRMNLPP